MADNINQGSVRLETPTSQRGKRTTRRQTVKIGPVGFVNFLREHTVVTLAVGFAIATQAQAVIKQLLSSFIDPLFGVLFNGQALSTKTWIVQVHNKPLVISWGAFVYAFIDFLFVLLAIFLLVKLFALDKIEKVQDHESKWGRTKEKAYAWAVSYTARTRHWGPV